MKKIFSIVLIFSFLFSTVGVTVAKSYCKMKKTTIENKKCCENKCNEKCCGKSLKVFKMSFESLVNSSKTVKNIFVKFVSLFTQTFFSFIHTEVKASCLFKLPVLTNSFSPSFTEVFRI